MSSEGALPIPTPAPPPDGDVHSVRLSTVLYTQRTPSYGHPGGHPCRLAIMAGVDGGPCTTRTGNNTPQRTLTLAKQRLIGVNESRNLPPIQPYYPPQLALGTGVINVS